MRPEWFAWAGGCGGYVCPWDGEIGNDIACDEQEAKGRTSHYVWLVGRFYCHPSAQEEDSDHVDAGADLGDGRGLEKSLPFRSETNELPIHGMMVAMWVY